MGLLLPRNPEKNKFLDLNVVPLGIIYHSPGYKNF